MDHDSRFSTVALFVFLVAILTLFFVPARSYGEDVVVGVVNSLTGPGAQMGQAARMAGQIASEEINAAGGVNGKKFEILYRDDETNPQKAVSAVNELIFKQGVKVIAGTNITNIANAVNEMINNEKILYMVMASGVTLVNPSKYPYTFRLNVPTDKEAEVLVKYVVEKVKGTKIGIIRDSTALGQTGYASVMAALKPYKIEPVAVEQYQPNDTDMTAQLLRLKAAGAEKIIAWGQGPDFIQVSNGLARMKWFPTIGSGIGVHFEVFQQMAVKEVANNWFGSMQKAFTFPKGGTVGPEVQKFLDKIKQKFGNVPVDAKIAGINYDIFKLYAKAVENVKSQDPDKIKKFLEGTSRYDGLVAKYSFSATNHDGFPLSDLALGWVMRGDNMIKERVE